DTGGEDRRCQRRGRRGIDGIHALEKLFVVNDDVFERLGAVVVEVRRRLVNPVERSNVELLEVVRRTGTARWVFADLPRKGRRRGEDETAQQRAAKVCRRSAQLESIREGELERAGVSSKRVGAWCRAASSQRRACEVPPRRIDGVDRLRACRCDIVVALRPGSEREVQVEAWRRPSRSTVALTAGAIEDVSPLLLQ